MKYLYVDNYKGFYNTYIPIKDVNFLVGENSTGKTSILFLLYFISNPNLWISADFNAEEIDHSSNYHELVSAWSKDKSYFDFGFIESDKNNYYNSFYMSFTEKDGAPSLKYFCFNYHNKEFLVKINKDSIFYKVNNIKRYKSDENFINDIFKEWKNSNRRLTKNYSVSKQLPKDSPYFIINFLIEQYFPKRQDSTSLGKLRVPTMGSIGWLAPIRTKPKRTYDNYKFGFSTEGEHTPYLIKKLQDEYKSNNFKQFIKEFGINSGLFDNIIAKSYFKSKTSPFEIDITLNNKHFNICNVGYGVSQSIPLVIETYARAQKTCLAIQQPEIHLHPKAQAALGDVFFSLAFEEHKQFLIETHSDYTIDRFRLNYKKHNNIELASQILFFDREENGNNVYQINIKPDGELSEEQPHKYREFFIKEEMNLLGLD